MAAGAAARVAVYAGSIPLDDRGWIALQERDDRPGIAHPGLVTTFGGLAEGDEPPLAAAARELSEELGLSLPQSRFVPLLETTKRTGDVVTECFLYCVHVPDVRSLRVAEGAGVAAGPPATLARDHRLTPTCRRAVEALLEDVQSYRVRAGGSR